jgi:hypothetical protein
MFPENLLPGKVILSFHSVESICVSRKRSTGMCDKEQLS